ncbi:nucleotide disphospho-sugar-binding domain-containing protein [Saccharopolyspora sp. NPDC047091]|uniref:nucleotide disphospho-sugar-binding domain-containing protein n=1 Tax=Saccharopolyspora sp. NPDC047091 TaxID=3155924 RepID=UPI0033EFAB3E
MTRYLVFPYPQHGHVRPMSALAAELVRRGDHVTVAVPPEFAAEFRDAGCEVTEFAATVGNAHVPERKPRRTVLPRRVVAALSRRRTRKRMVRRIRGCWTSWNPDVVVTDYVAGWGATAARAEGTPWVALSVTYALNDEVVLAELRARTGPIAESCARRTGLTRVHPALRMPGARAPLVLVNVVAELQPMRWSFDERFRFVGPLQRGSSVGYGGGDLPWDRIRSGPTVYVSSGTVFSRGAEYFRRVAEGFAGSGWCVVLATSHTDPAELGVLPENVVARRYVPQSEVLAHSDVFVTHAGMNSAMEGLALGIPMVLVPRAGDQLTTARRLRDLGVGVEVDANASPAQFRAAVDAVRDDESVAAALASHARRVRRAGGAGMAADLLSEFALSSTGTSRAPATKDSSSPAGGS